MCVLIFKKYLFITCILNELFMYNAVYVNPKNCYSYISLHDNVYLKCELNYLTEATNFNIIPSEHTLGLQLLCPQQMNSSIAPNSFSNLRFLIELRIDGCLPLSLPDKMLEGFKELRAFMVTNPFTHVGALPPSPMFVAPNLLRHTPYLENLDFSFTALRNLSDEFLCAVPRLETLNLGSNKIKSVDDIGCGLNITCCSGLLSLNISANEIEYLPHRWLYPITKILHLFVSHNIITKIEKDSLARMTSLMVLDLSYNLLESIPSRLLSSSRNLTELFLNHNKLDRLPNKLFQNHALLSILDLSHNKITHISSGSFLSLQQLEVLNLSNNCLQTLPGKLLNSFTKLRSLDIANNRLKFVPDFSRLSNIKEIDMHSNIIERFESSFKGNSQMMSLNLASNNISDLSNELFPNFLNIRTIILSDNKLTSIQITERCCPSLSVLFMDGNQIEVFNKTLLSFQNLKLLNLSRNKIQHDIDFSSVIPESLETLDVSRNFITQFYNKHEKNLGIITLKASHNLITVIAFRDFPSSLINIDLSFNAIFFLEAGAFSYFPKLKFVNLFSNRIGRVPRWAFQFFEKFPENKPLPLIILKNNSLICVCWNAWLLQYKRGLTNRWEPTLILPPYCEVIFTRMRKFSDRLYFDKANSNQFFCNYKNHSGFDTLCPRNCDCYYTIDNIHQADCGGHNNAWGQVKFYERSTHLFLDGVTEVPWDFVAHLPQLVSLFLNGSKISTLNKNKFATLPSLKELHLEDNELHSISQKDFAGLFNLRFLYLQNNFIANLDSTVFFSTSLLECLNLENNSLTHLQLWNNSKSLRSLSLSGNPFQCSCEFIQSLQNWIVELYRAMENSNDTYCQLENGTKIAFHYYNDSGCYTVERFVVSAMNRKLIFLLTVACCCFFIAVSAFLIYWYRHEIFVWIYGRYGLRLFHRNNEKEHKIFDAFISYSHEDETFVATQLVPPLEESYRLCLHQRDFLVGSYITESILEAIQNSSRTVFVISPHFVHSEWCRYEFKAAHQQALQDRCFRLIVIILQDVSPDEMEEELKMYMKTKTYLRWDDKKFWDRLRYAFPEGRPI